MSTLEGLIMLIPVNQMIAKINLPQGETLEVYRRGEEHGFTIHQSNGFQGYFDNLGELFDHISEVMGLGRSFVASYDARNTLINERLRIRRNEQLLYAAYIRAGGKKEEFQKDLETRNGYPQDFRFPH